MTDPDRAPLRLTTVDAFTDLPFAGNPAAICVLEAPADETWMQSLATEMQLSETAYLVPIEGGWNLRWFTPAVEVDLCGHATLAAAHVLFTELGVEGDELRFSTRSGWLTATRGTDGWIGLDFPADPPRVLDPAEVLPGLLEALGTDGTAVVRVAQGRSDVLVELADAAAVRACAPDHRALTALPVRGAIVTAAAEPGADHHVESRFFAPGSGIDEDPVTGSAHCLLGPYWAAALGTDDLVARQVSPRGGTLRVHVRGDRIGLEGRAVTVLRAELAPAAGPR